MRNVVLIVAAALLAGGCDDEPDHRVALDTSAHSGVSAQSVRAQDPVQLRRGEQIFRKDCAECHGGLAQGAFNWRQRGADGKFPPPPLNGTGHAWHHPKAALIRVIRNGSPGGQGNMPPWKDKLSEQDIEDVIAWFQSLWPDEVHAVWARIDADSKQP
jgi:mono/diheme cytochrome c family protein